jgi:ABC-type dipeptide/oligopeptide/nickel transport system ATPase subunit
MIEVANVSLSLERRDRLGQTHGPVRVLDGVNLSIGRGEKIGLTGPSGSGKSTLARCLAGWLTPSEGKIHRAGEVQLVMQDPGASLNPRFSALGAIEEPLRIQRVSRHPATELLTQVGIGLARANDPIGRFSGGERARIAIARAMAALRNPSRSLLILDESLSALDEVTCGQILRILSDWREARGLTLLMVAHDREMLGGWTDRILFMQEGRLLL